MAEYLMTLTDLPNLTIAYLNTTRHKQRPLLYIDVNVLINLFCHPEACHLNFAKYYLADMKIFKGTYLKGVFLHTNATHK